MAYSAFKKLHPAYILFSAGLVLLFFIAAGFIPTDISDNAFPSLLAFYVKSKAWGLSFGLLVSLGTAYLMMYLLNVHNIFKPKTFLPFTFFGLALALFPSNLYLNSLLVSNALFLLCINKMLYLATGKGGNHHTFEASFFLGLASLFYWPAIFTLPVVLLATIISGLFNVKSFFSWLLGFIFPWAFARAIYFLFELDFNFAFSWQAPDLVVFFKNKVALYNIIYVLLSLIIGLFFYFKSLEKNTVEVRNQKRIVGLSSLVWILSAWCVFATPVNGGLFFVMLAPILAFLISTFLYHATWKPVVLAHLIITIALLIHNYAYLIA
ncbi:hypothetical protein [Luteibaculum oceani]|uniref:Beta-carotene 15,15'-monooxygenase n=1 Tax=Luteibaculum oceani TaxID=1294296 RepID=A0A5C6VLB2_9FLAO|nr:hypothetical protein [Luteibaculum oceani]TXC85196.1 hypothetical protein FRX97_00820 [Luteibaculum oceani]